MDEREKEHILQSARLLQEYENTPAAFTDPYSDMSDIEKSKLIIYQQELLARQDRQAEDLRRQIDALVALLAQSNATNASLMELIKSLRDEQAQLQSKMEELIKSNAAMTEQLALDRKNRFGSRSQKGTKSKADKEKTHQEEKEDFDGTNPPEPTDNGDASETQADDSGKTRTERQLMADAMRHGTRYRTMKANDTITHRSDIHRLPAGSEFVKMESRFSYEQKVSVIEHEYQLVTYRLGGVLYTAYLPADGEPEIIDRVEGTKASADFLAHLSFNHFFLGTPLYREIRRLREQDMRVSRMTLTNWLHKGSLFLSGIVDYLKDKALEKDSVVNCDETWCRVKVDDKYRKRYIWCLVNRELKTAIYCYEDGSRGRDALKSIIEGKELKALQSDGYNVYMYLDKEMVDIDHICCLAHARAKFKYAHEQGDDKDARHMLDCIAELYALERAYAESGLSTDDITKARQSLKTKEIQIRLRSKLDSLLAEDHPPRGELMEKAVRYLDTFWTQIMAYTRDGRYSIDNNIAERCIRPYSGERKNSLFYGSHKMARASAIYHTVIETCRLSGVSVLDYLRKFFREIVRGNRDYAGLMPRTIGLTPLKQ